MTGRGGYDQRPTLFKFSIAYGHLKFLELLFELGKAHKVEERHLELAKERGKWSIHELLSSKKVGNEIVKTVEKEKDEIIRRQAIASAFQKSVNSLFKEKTAKRFMENLRIILCNLMKSRDPISDDLVLSVLTRKENRKHVFKAVCASLRDILQIPLNKKGFFWFEKYILKSRVYKSFSFSFFLFSLFYWFFLAIDVVR